MTSVTLADVCELITDGTHYTPTNVGAGFPFLTVKDVGPNGLDFDGCARISQGDFDAADAGNSAPKMNDVLFSKDGTVGKVHVVETHDQFAVLSSLAILRPSEHVDRKFLGRMLCTPEVLGQAVKRTSGSAIRRIILSDLKKVEIPLPPIEEQRRIAAILDQADVLRAKRRQALAQLDTLTQSVFHDMFGDGKFDSVSAGDLMPSMRNGLSPAARGAHAADVLTLSAVTRGDFDPRAVKPGRFAIEPSRDKRVRAGDFMMCRGNGNKGLVGAGAYAREDRDDLVFPDTVIAGRVDLSRVTMRFLSTAWKQQEVRRQIEAVARTTNGTYKINQRTLSAVVLAVPSMEMQRSFGDRVELIETHRIALKRILAHNDEFFTSLQSRAFRGEL